MNGERNEKEEKRENEAKEDEIKHRSGEEINKTKRI